MKLEEANKCFKNGKFLKLDNDFKQGHIVVDILDNGKEVYQVQKITKTKIIVARLDKEGNKIRDGIYPEVEVADPNQLKIIGINKFYTY